MTQMESFTPPREPDELNARERLTAFEVFAQVQERVAARQPAAVIRLGDGEGALLGYPRFTSRADVDNFLNSGCVRRRCPKPTC